MFLNLSFLSSCQYNWGSPEKSKPERPTKKNYLENVVRQAATAQLRSRDSSWRNGSLNVVTRWGWHLFFFYRQYVTSPASHLDNLFTQYTLFFLNNFGIQSGTDCSDVWEYFSAGERKTGTKIPIFWYKRWRKGITEKSTLLTKHSSKTTMTQFVPLTCTS